MKTNKLNLLKLLFFMFCFALSNVPFYGQGINGNAINQSSNGVKNHLDLDLTQGLNLLPCIYGESEYTVAISGGVDELIPTDDPSMEIHLLLPDEPPVVISRILISDYKEQPQLEFEFNHSRFCNEIMDHLVEITIEVYIEGILHESFTYELCCTKHSHGITGSDVGYSKNIFLDDTVLFEDSSIFTEKGLGSNKSRDKNSRYLIFNSLGQLIAECYSPHQIISLNQLTGMYFIFERINQEYQFVERIFIR